MIFWYDFAPDSSKMDPTQIKKQLHHFIFVIALRLSAYLQIYRPTEMVHLSIFAELNMEYHYCVLEITVQTVIV